MHDCISNLVGIPDGQGKLVRLICRSSRAAALIAHALMSESSAKGMICMQVMSLSSLLAERASELGLASRIVGSLGREMKLQSILDEEENGIFESDEPLSQYVTDFNRAISLLKSYRIPSEKLLNGGRPDAERETLCRVYGKYSSWLEENGFLDIEDLWEEAFPQEVGAGRHRYLATGFDGDTLSIRKLESIEAELLPASKLLPLRKGPMQGERRLITLKARQGMALAREVARLIKKRHVDSGVSYAGFCVSIPGTSKASQEIAAAMDWAGIPCTEPLWVNLADHPLGYSVELLCELISLRGQKIDAFRYMRNPYFGIKDAGVISLLKSKSKTKGLIQTLDKWSQESKYGYLFRIDEKDQDYEANSSAQREFKAWIEKMAGDCARISVGGSWDAMAHRFLSYVEEELAFLTDATSEPALRALEEKAWEGLKDIIRKIEEAGRLISADGGKASWHEFAYTLTQALQKKRVLAKGASPLGVAVAEAADIAGLRFDTTVLYEPTEGYFPKAEKTSWLISQESLPELDDTICVAPREAVIGLEKEMFMAAADTAESRLVLALPSIGSDEREINKSVWVDDLVERKSAEGFSIESLEIKSKLPAPAEGALCITENEGSMLEEDRDIYTRGRQYGFLASWENDIKKVGLLREASRKIMNADYKWSASKMNKYLKCSLSALPETLLGIREKQEYEESITNASKGTLAHEALKSAVKVLAEIRQEGVLSRLEAAARAKAAAEEAMSYGKSFKYADTSESVWALMVEGVREIVMRFIDEEAEYLWDGDTGGLFKPAHFELMLPTEEGPQELEIGDRSIRFTAKIDRVDLIQEGASQRCVVYDYKTGEPPIPKEDCQVAFYSIACSQALGVDPVASIYLSIKPVKASKKKNERQSMRDASRRGIFYSRFMGRLGYSSVNFMKEASITKNSLLKLKDDDPEELVRMSRERVGEVIRSISEGGFLDHVVVDDRRCEYCLLKAFCASRRLDLSDNANGEGEADNA